MSFQLNVPPSVVAKSSRLEEEEGDDEEPKKQSREDWKKLKELEEARKAGTAPAMQDEEGKDINPHIPQYIMQAPWYFGASQATLRHQRIQEEKIREYNRMGQWYHRGVQKGQVATKYRKGACENCGAMTHKKKDCLERPRKTGAKFTGDKIAPDEFLQPDLSFDYSSKRDRWNGYDLDEHKRIVEDFAKIEEAKRQLKAERLDNSVLEVHQDDEDKDVEDEDKYADHIDMPGTKFETKQRITVRNLRIREDTAKYLYNLDVESSYYDPKTRSMRENPFVRTGKDANELPYAGDNFVRWSGDAHGMAESQVFAWEAYEKGAEVNLQADPTKLEFLSKEYQKRKEDYKTDQKGSILAKYGGEEHLEAPPKQLLMAQTEDYVEYSRHGTVIKGQEKATVKSIYEEDVYINNHTSVWGSFWKDGHWGYKCCHSFIKESYCTGEAGKSAEQTTIPQLEEASEPEPGRSLMEQHQEKVKEKKKKKKSKKKKKKHKKMKESSSSSEEEEEEDPEVVRERKIQEFAVDTNFLQSGYFNYFNQIDGLQVNKAMKKLEEREKLADKLLAIDERKRPYNIMYDFDAPTEEEMEAYRRKQKRMEDPMANMFTR